MVGLADVRRWDAGALDERGRELGSHIERLVGYEDEVRALAPPDWTGPASLVARLAQDALGARLAEAVANAAGVRSAVTGAADRVRATLRTLRAIEADAAAAGLRVTADGLVEEATPLGPGAPAGAAADRAAARADVERRLRELLLGARMLDDELATTLEAAARGEIDGAAAAGGGGTLDLDAARDAGAANGALDFTGAVPRGPEELARLRREGRITQERYGTELQAYWALRAYGRAGIDPSAWDLDAGAGNLRPIIEQVYRYYGDLALANPYMQWAGMANMIGPSFAAGFLDLAMLRRLGGALARAPVPVGVSGHAARALAGLGTAELAYYERTLLGMQKEIFFDQAPMHEAYLAGGMSAIREMRSSGAIDVATADSWELIDAGRRTGDDDLVAAGNKGLLQREQYRIIADDYDRMRGHLPSGPAFTYALTAVGEPSIPGAQSYAGIDPVTVAQETPGPERLGYPDRIGPVDLPFGGATVDNPAQVRVEVETPLPDGDISDRDTRWRLIEQDTFPKYQELLRDDPQQTRELWAEPVGDRIDDHRLQERVDDLARRLATDWAVRVEP